MIDLLTHFYFAFLMRVWVTQDGSTRWQARFAVLSLLATFLRLSPAVQRRAVREWDIVKALFGLLWERTMERPALRMVSPLFDNLPRN